MEPIDYSKRTFNFYPTNGIVFAKCIDGRWTKPEFTNDFNLTLHCFAGVFHYAPSCFEGLKAYRGADDRVRLFRPDENAKRMFRTAQRTCMPPIPVETFLDCCKAVVRRNAEYVPPYGTGGSLYLRPVQR